MSEEEASVLKIPTKKIKPNPDNPRLLFDPEDLDALKKSIDLRGIMVPLIVFRERKAEENFVLLDGERRLRCAKELKFEDVPAHEITKPSKTENIIRMFNIHNVRKGWELVPTAYSLDKLIKLLEKEGKKPTNSELSKLTGMSAVRVSECRRVMKYKKYLHLSLDTNLDKRIGGDFFSQLDLVFDKLKKYPEILHEYPRDKLIQIMIKKKQDGTIDNFITEFRMLKRILESDKKGVKKKRIVESVREFIRSEPPRTTSQSKKSKAMSVQEVYERTFSSVYTEHEIIKNTRNLINLLSQISYLKSTNKKELRTSLSNLTNKIEKFFKS